MASSSSDATAGSSSQIRYVFADGGTIAAYPAAASSRPGPASAARPEPMAVTPHSTTNTPYAADHIQTCWCVVNTGSNSTGELSSAKMEPGCDSAYIRG